MIPYITDDLKHTVYHKAKEGRTITLYSLISVTPQELWEKLLKSLTWDNGQQVTPFLAAAQRGHTSVVQVLLKYFNQDIEQVGLVKLGENVIVGATALWCAAAGHHLETVKVLVEHGASLEHATATGSTPLRASCYSGDLDVVKFLLSHGANIHTKNKFSNNCLMLAAHRGYCDIVSYLIQQGLSPNEMAMCGTTALHFAVERNYLQICNILVLNGASITAKSKQNLTPLELAAAEGKGCIVAYFMSLHEVSPQMTLDALELLGASFANTRDNYDLQTAYQYFLAAQRLRENKGLPAKASIPPLEAYGYQVECQTMEELEAISNNDDALHLEALLIRERLLTYKDYSMVHPMVYRASVYADTGNFDQCIALWMRCMQLLHNNGFNIFKELVRFTEVFSQMLVNSIPIPLPAFAEILKCTVGQLQRDKENLQDSDPIDKDFMSKCLESNIHSALYLISLFAHMISLNSRFLLSNSSTDTTHTDKDMIYEIRKLVYQIVKVDARLPEYGSTLLHMACDENTLIDEFHVIDILKYPDPLATKLLLHCGADPNARDSDGETPLFRVVRSLEGGEWYACMGQLLRAGCHIDTTNYEDEAAEDVATPIALFKLQTQVRSLQCLAAQVVKYKCDPQTTKNCLTKDLLIFVELH